MARGSAGARRAAWSGAGVAGLATIDRREFGEDPGWTQGTVTAEA